MSDIQYKFGSDGNAWLHRAYDVTQDRFGMFHGSCVWMTTPEDYKASIPGPFQAHPYFSYLEMDKYSMRTHGAFVLIEAEFFGIDGNDSEPLYELSNSAGEFPIEGHPDFSAIVLGAGLVEGDLMDEDGKFKGFPVKLPNGDAYPEKRNLAGVEAYLGFGQVLWRKTWSSRSEPNQSDVQRVGRVDSPDGDPPTPQNRDWILTANTFSKRGKTNQRTMEWKLSGSEGANPDIYGGE
jgi:hypothetical protein